MIENHLGLFIKNFLSVLLSFLAFSLFAQDLHFSQFLATPMYINPAMTALAGGDCRAAALYRSQWRQISIPYNTLYGSYEHKMYWGKNLAGVGLMLANDQSGDAQYSVNDIRLSFAYHKRIGANFLSIGLQPGFTIKQIGMSNLTYPVQYDPSIGGYNSGLNNFENGNIQEVKFMDVNAGLRWAGYASQKLSYRVGVSAIHILQPVESFFNASFKIYRKYNIHAGVEIAINNSMALFPNGIFMTQGSNKEVLAGLNLLMSNSSLKLMPGLHYRSNDAVIPSFSVLIKQIQFGLSYDLNISSLQTATNNQGGLELSLIYRCFNSQLDQMKVPCERF